MGQCAVSVKVPIDQDQWSHQCPHIECDADPAGGDLHPHRRPLAGDGLILGVRAIPVGEGHHDVERRKEQHEVEERVRIRDTIFLIVHSSVGAVSLLKAVRLRPIFNESRLITGQSQLVDLGIG